MEPVVTPFPLPELARSLGSLPGVGPATVAGLAERGYRTWGDLLFFLPRRYEDRRRATPLAELVPGQRALVRGRVESSGRWGRRGKVWRMVLAQDDDRLSCLWFRLQKSFLEGFAVGAEVFAVGEVGRGPAGENQMIHPELYRVEEVTAGHSAVGCILPVYPEVAGAPPGRVRRFMAELLARTAEFIPDPLPGLLPPEVYPLAAGRALALAHLPPDDAATEYLDPVTAPWRRALAANELLYYELGLALVRRGREETPGRALDPPGELLGRFLEALPFRLTPGQQAAVEAIRLDLARPTPMGRLLAGDVGTGKTVVAAAAAVIAAEAGCQAALMAPTEVLARQHLAGLERLLAPLGLEVALATGSQNGAARRRTAEAAARGAALVVGTHALFGDRLSFGDLGLVIIDEQHRFGVHQRLGLAAKGDAPHLLVLSATPIPRTLGLALAGHLDISTLDQRPGGPPRVTTRVVGHAQRRLAVDALAACLEEGGRAYVICPLVEASQGVEAQDAQATHRRLADFFPEVGVGLVHGRLSGEEQEAALERFRDGRDRVLVATTVVEVGVDVPEATLMIVLGAERFGLSQLHQLRGRVGRGARPGACWLVAGPEPGELGRRRLAVLAETVDGLAVAEADLALRGPGEALGARQSGLPPFRLADWSQDAEMVPALREVIAQWLAADPGMADPRLAPVRDETLRRWGRRLGLTEAG